MLDNKHKIVLYSYQTKYRLNMYLQTRKKTDKMNTKFGEINNEQSTISYRITMNQSRTTRCEHRIRQSKRSPDPGEAGNEPNFNHKASTKHANGVDFTNNISSKTTNFSSEVHQKTQKMHAFCNYLTLIHLTPCISKAYITFYPGIHFAHHERSLTAVFVAGDIKNAKRTQFQNFNNRVSRILYRELCKTNPIHLQPARCASRVTKYTKRTQFHTQHLFPHLAQRVTGHGARVTIHAKQTQFAKCQNKRKC